MTVAEMIAQRTAKLTAIKDSSNAAVTAKGGTAADDLSGLPAAIESITSGGGALPVLTNPAEVGHVIAGKEYIDGSGNKQTGTLVVCDSIEEVETIGEAGVGLYVDIESPVDGSAGELTIPEPNLLPENIKSGVSIFNVAGSVKEIRTETGTITPAEDTTSIQIPCSANAKYAIIVTTSENKADWDILGAVCNNFDYEGKIPKNCFSSYYYSSAIRYSTTNARFDDGVHIDEIAPTRFYRAGTAYEWTAYYWEDT